MTFKKNALKGAKKLKVLSCQSSVKFKMNSLKGTSKTLTIFFDDEELAALCKKKLKRAGNKNVKVKVNAKTTKE